MAAVTSPNRGSLTRSSAHLRVVGPDERVARLPGPATYRRRRVVAALLALAVVAGAAFVLGRLGGGPLAPASPAQASKPMVPASTTDYIVQPGDTLWSIARRIQPEGDVRPLVQSLSRAQGASPLRVGQHIKLR